MAKTNTYIDLFAGCGGLSLGLHLAGWNGLFAIEKNRAAFSTLEHNLINKKSHFDWPSWLPQSNHDINDVLSKYRNELKLLRGNVDLVVGGPPCQGFSTAGKRNENDQRNQLIKSYIKFIRLVQPKVIFFENVKGFTQKFDRNKIKGRIYSEYVKGALERKVVGCDGYKVSGQLINFAEYGVPQKRTRFILVGVRKDIVDKIKPDSFFTLLSTNKTEFLLAKGLSANTTLEEAISDLLAKHGQIPSPDSKSFKAGLYGKTQSRYQKYLRNGSEKPDSHRFANHKLSTVERFNEILNSAKRNRTIENSLKQKFGLKKHTLIPLDKNSPALTITTLPDDYLHYAEPRIFTVREYARIQSFNDWYEFKGKYTTGGKVRTQEVPRYSQIGNAIPPLFGEQAGLTIKNMIS